MNIAQAYDKVNAIQQVAPVQTLTFGEAEKAVRKMYRHLTGNKFPLPCVETSGNRVTWTHQGTYRINAGNGWIDLLHLFSHWYFRRTNGEDRPHSKKHARLEVKLRKYAIKHGWLTGSLRRHEKPEAPASTKDEARAKLIERRRAQVIRLERKIKALTTRMKKAKRSLGALERAAGRAGSKVE